MTSKNEPEYKCYLLDPATKMSHIEGEPLLSTDCLGKASGFIYNLFKEQGVEACVYQQRIESYRGYYRKPARAANGRFI